MQSTELRDFIVEQLEEIKARDIKVLDIGDKSTIADFMVICSGTSNRHVKSIATLLIKELKDKNIPPIGVEGEDAAEWVLVDSADVIVHVMLPQTRDYYQLEKLWE
ncbi:ribosome silencing factor [Aliikangiella coralliicola]|uniref:Ribosomal silencing factor RsfS n=1 Tax=Aliikangiella coralliicola TaxID=2592383 RepID=A0A545U7K1_9GAMM|nr:ribosome silencing factor [Aliikangiella coralliicola]TQV85447.1 ribosome silencing factor [Aliikangiella coralliicola]